MFRLKDLQAVNRNILAELIQHFDSIGYKPILVSGVGDQADGSTPVGGLHHCGQIVHCHRTTRLQEDSPHGGLACSISMAL